MYNTHRSQVDGIVLEVPQFVPTIHNSTKLSGTRFGLDAPKIWNYLSNDNVHFATTLFPPTEVEVIFFIQKHTLVSAFFPWIFSVVLTST